MNLFMNNYTKNRGVLTNIRTRKRAGPSPQRDSEIPTICRTRLYYHLGESHALSFSLVCQLSASASRWLILPYDQSSPEITTNRGNRDSDKRGLRSTGSKERNNSMAARDRSTIAPRGRGPLLQRRGKDMLPHRLCPLAFR